MRSGWRAWPSGRSARWNFKPLRLVSGRLGREEYGFVTPGMFHLPPIMDIQLHDLYMNASQRLGWRLSESRARGVTASAGGTFNNCPYTNLKPTVSAIRISKLEFDRHARLFCVQRCVHERWAGYGGARGGIRRTTDGAAGRKVGRTLKITTQLFSARSVNNRLKRPQRCSTQSAIIIIRFAKNIHFQKQRSVFEALRRRRVEPQGRLIIIERGRPTTLKCLQIFSVQQLMPHTGYTLPFGCLNEHWKIGHPLQTTHGDGRFKRPRCSRTPFAKCAHVVAIP